MVPDVTTLKPTAQLRPFPSCGAPLSRRHCWSEPLESKTKPQQEGLGPGAERPRMGPNPLKQKC